MTEPVLAGTCQICGDEVYQYTTISCEVAFSCGRCGKWTCTGCGGLSPGYGYGSEDESRYGKVCKECYYELQSEYAARWENEFGPSDPELGKDNPYDLRQEAEEWWKNIRQQREEP